MTDVVSRNGDVVSGIDAKYYRAESPESSPGWSDLVKQFFYKQALEQKFPLDRITNWFVFPGYKSTSPNGALEKVVVYDPVTLTPLNGTFPPIGCSYLCPMELMKMYAESKSYKFSEVSYLYSNV